MVHTFAKTYELVNKIMFGLLAINCIGQRCRIIDLYIPFVGLSVLHMIIIFRIAAVNWQFWDILNYIQSRQTTRYKNMDRHEINTTNITLFTSDEAANFLRIQKLCEDLQDVRTVQKINCIWLSVLELTVFTIAYIVTPGYQLPFVLLGILFNSWQEVEQI